MASTTLTVQKDARILKATQGAGGARELPIGYSGGFLYRALCAFPALNYGPQGLNVQKILSVKLKARNTQAYGSPAYILGRGASPAVKVQRLTADFTEGTATESSASNAVTWANQPAATSTHEVTSGTLPTADNAWWSGVDVTQQFCDAMPATILRPDGVTPCGVGGVGNGIYRCRLIGPADDGTTATSSQNTEVYQDDSTSKMVLEITYDDNQAPSKPTVAAVGLPVYYGNTKPGDVGAAAQTAWETGEETGAVIVATDTGTDMKVSVHHVDLDGDKAKKWRIRAYASTASDAAIAAGSVSPRNDVTFSASTVAGIIDALSQVGVNTPGAIADPPFVVGAKYRVSAVSQDVKGAWGLDPVAGGGSGWSKVDTHLVTMARKPKLKTPRISTGLTPVYSASIEAGTIIAARVVVTLSVANGPSLTKYDSGKQTVGGSPTGFALTYAGSTLDPGVPVTVEMWLWNESDVMSDSSGKITSTPTAQTGPATVSPNDTSTKQSTRNPSITITDPSFDGYQRRLYRKVSGAWSMVSDSGIVALSPAVTSKVITTPTGLFDWGETFGHDEATRPALSGQLGGFSPIYETYINAAPTAPNPASVAASVDSGTVTLGGVIYPYRTVTDSTPDYTFPFTDVDLNTPAYVEAPSRREIEIDHWNGSAWVAHTSSPYVITTGITNIYTVATAFTAGGTHYYRARARYDDSASVRSAWSDYLVVRFSANVPALTRTAPTNNSTVTNPHPLIDWGFTGAESKAQATKRVQVFDTTGGAFDLLFDSGVVTDATSSYQLPAFGADDEPYIDTGMEIDAVVTVTDTDNLSSSITFNYTTSFTKPAVLTGLALTPDTDLYAVVATVDASVDANVAEYWWYRRNGSGEFERFDRTTLPTTTDYEAALNVSVDYSVTQHTGQVTDGESDAITETTTITNAVSVHVFAGDASHTDELRWIDGGIREDEDYAEGVFSPLPPETGEARQIHRNGGVRGLRITFDMIVTPDDTRLITMLREVRQLYRAGGPTYSVVKSAAGDVWRCKLGPLPRSLVAGGERRITVTATVVA